MPIKNYYIFSYGGCGSTMLYNFLSLYGKSYHLHDPSPPKFLTDLCTTVPTLDTKSPIRMSQNEARKIKKEDCKVIYIYRSPVESKISRPSWQHCCHMGGDFITHKNIISQDIGDKVDWIEKFANNGVDLNFYENHFDNWVKESKERDYDVLFVKYDFLWETIGEVMSFCDINPKESFKFPAKRETKKDLTPKVRLKLEDMYDNLQTKIDQLDPVMVVSK